jgi:hypothetical protein
MARGIVPTTAAPHPQLYRFSWPIYVVLVSLAWLVNFPGRLSSDTLDMITQGQYPVVLNDWQAPVVTWLYSIFTPLGQPSGALLLQALLLFFYPSIVLVQSNSRWIDIAKVPLAIALGIFDAALIAISGQILRDVILIGAVLCFLGAIDLSINFSRYWNWFALKLAILLLIFAVRPTNFLMLATNWNNLRLFCFRRRA